MQQKNVRKLIPNSKLNILPKEVLNEKMMIRESWERIFLQVYFKDKPKKILDLSKHSQIYFTTYVKNPSQSPFLPKKPDDPSLPALFIWHLGTAAASITLTRSSKIVNPLPTSSLGQGFLRRTIDPGLGWLLTRFIPIRFKGIG